MRNVKLILALISIIVITFVITKKNNYEKLKVNIRNSLTAS
jgi:hypothetical protein